MNRTTLFLALSLLATLLLPGTARAQEPPRYTNAEVGIDEKLGTQLPMDLILKDEDGKEVKLGALIDRPTILTLNYFRCAGICTPLLNGVVDVINQTPLKPGENYRVITVSFDERDTPDMALQKRTNYLKQITKPIDPSAWRFLTGPASATKPLCDAVGFHFKPDGNDFIHAGAIFVLSPKGRITQYIYGVNYLPAELQVAVKNASREIPRPSVNKWLKFCYNKDPQGRGYVFSVTKAVAALTLILAGIFALVLFSRGGTGKPEAEDTK